MSGKASIRVETGIAERCREHGILLTWVGTRRRNSTQMRWFKFGLAETLQREESEDFHLNKDS